MRYSLMSSLPAAEDPRPHRSRVATVRGWHGGVQQPFQLGGGETWDRRDLSGVSAQQVVQAA